MFKHFPFQASLVKKGANMTHLDKFLDILKIELPDICSNKDLVEHLQNILKKPCTLTRMRSRGQTPAYFSIDPNIYYLKEDVIGVSSEFGL